MEKRPLGRTGIDVPVLCLGTMMYGEQIGDEEAFRQMDRCMERGVNFFDTAELYTIPPKPETQGESERTIGRWLSGRGGREKVVIASKVCGASAMNWFRSNGEKCRLNKEQIVFAVERSLKNLQTDYIDIYQTHWPDRYTTAFDQPLRGFRIRMEQEFVPIEETLEAMDVLVRDGKIRYAAVSNENSWGVMKHLQAAEQKGLPRIVSIQNAYNLLNRTFEQDLAEFAMRENVGLLAYSPLAQGALTGKYLGGKKPAGSRGELFGRLDRYETPGTDPAIAAYVALAEKHGIHPATLAMQFVNTRPFLTSNIFGARDEAQLELILDSVDFPWTDEIEEEIIAIRSIHNNPCP